MVASLARLLRIASIATCLIVLASFMLFVVNQTSDASAHQQAVLNGSAPPVSTPGAPSSPKASSSHVGSVHKVIDEASNTLTSPFKGVTAGSTSEWTVRGANLLLALVVYGFGIGFVARVLRMAH